MAAFPCDFRVVASETVQYLVIESHLFVPVVAPVPPLWILNYYEVLVLEGVPRPVIVNCFDLVSLVDRRGNVNDFDADVDVFRVFSVVPPFLHPLVLVHPGPGPCPDPQPVFPQVDGLVAQVEHVAS